MNQTSKKALIICLILIAAIGVAVYGRTQGGDSQLVDVPIKIGGVFALTGLGSWQGEQEFKASKLALEEINAKGGIDGRMLELIAEDVSLDKLKVAPAAASKLIGVDKVTAMVGTTWDEPAQVIVPIVDAAKIPMVGHDQTRSIEKAQSYGYFFNTRHQDEIAIDTLLAHAQSKGIRKVAMLRPLAAGFYQFVADHIHKSAANYGITIIDDVNMNNSATTDFRTFITKIKASKPDAVFMVVNGFTECNFLRQASELKLGVPVLSVDSAQDYKSLSDCAKVMENITFVYPKKSAGYAAFAQRFESRYGVPPQTPSAVTAYDSMMMLAEGLKKTDGKGGEALREAIKSLSGYKGAAHERIVFDSLGYVETAPDAFEIKTVREGKFVRAE